jgi:hypothetical protein
MVFGNGSATCSAATEEEHVSPRPGSAIQGIDRVLSRLHKGDAVGRWEIVQQGNGTTITKRHPIWNALVWLFGIGLVVSSIERAPWLIVPTILIVIGAIVLVARTKRCNGGTNQGTPT